MLDKPRPGPVARVFGGLTIAAALLAAATLVYGIVNFPDAPLRATERGYAGKGGTPRTEADYEAFQRWESTLFVVFPTTFALGLAYAFASRGPKVGPSSS